MSRVPDSGAQESREPISRIAVGEASGLNKGAWRACALVHLSEHQSRYAHPHRDRRESPLRRLEEDLEDRLPALRPGAQNLCARGVYRGRPAGRMRPAAPGGLEHVRLLLTSCAATRAMCSLPLWEELSSRHVAPGSRIFAR